MTEPTDTTAIAVALAELRGTMAEGFATVNGSLALLTQRHDQVDRRIEQEAARVDLLAGAIDALEKGETERQKRNDGRLDALERARWPLPSVAAVVGVSGLALSLYQLAGK
ncbi:hypothetical protein [Streptomyces griseoloalbus]|uniref:Uncharacterized protein n=1 Tax=Streptomyces griseoloalbus TaxID=67303 RepID=A0A7W8FAQ9_9ACTN|nr:hypothetical protein [Streptomyces albaduncus]MBB5128432.1 hypothetical protein [Streptomyces albaduncus]GGW67842.1 hypothetical protein GCM10010340_52440 [Streptomyces albaduncus]